MEIDWAIVKKKTLWQYEQLTAKLLAVLEYDFVREHYGHSMAEARVYAGRLRQDYLQHGREADFIDAIGAQFGALGVLGIGSYADLVRRVGTKADCERFVQETGFDFEALIEVLDFLFRWVLLFRVPVKELVRQAAGAAGCRCGGFKKAQNPFQSGCAGGGSGPWKGAGHSPQKREPVKPSCWRWRTGPTFRAWLMCAAKPSCTCAAAGTTRWRNWRTRIWHR